jgi:hypothetical protein
VGVPWCRVVAGTFITAERRTKFGQWYSESKLSGLHVCYEKSVRGMRDRVLTTVCTIFRVATMTSGRQIMRSNMILRTSKVPGADLALSAELAWTPKYRFSIQSRSTGRNFALRLYVVQKKAWNEDRKYRGSGGVAGSFEERKFS